MGTDARDLPCAWKTGSGGKCCWLLLPTTVRLGFRGAGRVSRQNKGGKLLFTRYPPCVESAKCYRRISSGEGNVKQNTNQEGDCCKPQLSLFSSVIALHPFPHPRSPGRSLSSSASPQKADREGENTLVVVLC